MTRSPASGIDFGDTPLPARKTMTERCAALEIKIAEMQETIAYQETLIEFQNARIAGLNEDLVFAFANMGPAPQRGDA